MTRLRAMKRFVVKCLLTFAVLFITFGAVTTFGPCKYVSKRAVLTRLGLIVEASKSQDCDCNQAWSGDCPYADGCNPTDWGCGPFWILTCYTKREG